MTTEIAILVTAIATAIYGLATLLLWLENREDRKQRDRHFREETESRKVNDLRSAFYEAWGYWQGYYMGSPETRGDATQMGRLYEAMTRFECQLRMNGYDSQANDLGFTVRNDIHSTNKPLADAGVAIGMLPPHYKVPVRLPAEQDFDHQMKQG